jgi:hypothetical protein
MVLSQRGRKNIGADARNIEGKKGNPGKVSDFISHHIKFKII